MTRQVTLVVGPPCAGKSTFVAEHAQPSDLIVDWNQLAIDAGSPVTHDHAPTFAAAATTRRNELERSVAASDDIRAWVIRTLPREDERAACAARLGTTRLEVIDPGVHTCLQRARADNRHPDVDAAILRWYGITWGARCYDPPTATPARRRFRKTKQWQAVRAIVLRGQPDCWRGHPMRYGVPYNRHSPDPLYPTVDHMTPVSQGGALYDLANCRPACWAHNSDHSGEPGALGVAVAPPRRVSEAW